MPNDFNVSTTSSSAPLPAEAQVRAETTSETPAVSTKAASSPSTALFANPTLQLNADLGIVVIEFRNDTVTNQIPSQRQLDAYIAGSAKLPGAAPAPAPVTSSAPAAPAAATSSATSAQAVTASAAAAPVKAPVPATATPAATPAPAPTTPATSIKSDV